MFDEKFIKISKIKVLKNIIEYELELGSAVKKYFIKPSMKIEYDYDIDSIPKGIVIIPLLLNLLPIAWFTNSKLIVDEIDKTFFFIRKYKKRIRRYV